MSERKPFRCSKCGSRYFGSVTEQKPDGSIWKTHEECHDEFNVGCNARFERLVMIAGPKNEPDK
jgi:hypothetical protein